VDVGQDHNPDVNIGSSEEHSKYSLRRRIERHIWRRVSSGFLFIIPLVVTIIVLDLLIDFLDSFVRPLPLVHDRPYDVYGIGFVVILVLLYVVGSIFAGRIGSKALNWQDFLIRRIPVVKSIYGVASQATDALSAPLERQFSRVVFIEWPRPGVQALGLVTGHIRSPKPDLEDTVVIYIPTVPNPTSGMLAWVSKNQVTETDITVEDAMKAVFSGGIVLPDLPALDGPLKSIEISDYLKEEDKSSQ